MVLPLAGVKLAFKAASLCGLSPDDFWALTPFAFSLIAQAHQQKSKSEDEKARWAIWHQAALPRMKRMPSLKEFMRPVKKADKVGIDEAEIKSLLKAYQNGTSRKPEC